MTIREIIVGYQNEVKSDDLLPERAAEIQKSLAALMGNVNDEIRRRDMEYKKVLLKHLETQEKASHAKIMAETTPEYELMREARDTKELLVEMVRSLKYFLKAKEEEFRMGKFQ
jgi:hypothetical protein